MDKGTVVSISCTFEPGGFPSERVFVISDHGAEFRGVTDLGYCYGREGNPLGDAAALSDPVAGQLLGLVVRPLENQQVRVHLPDGEVYDLNRSILHPARETINRHVSVKS